MAYIADITANVFP